MYDVLSAKCIEMNKDILEVAAGDDCRATYQGKKYAAVIVAKGKHFHFLRGYLGRLTRIKENLLVRDLYILNKLCRDRPGLWDTVDSCYQEDEHL